MITVGINQRVLNVPTPSSGRGCAKVATKTAEAAAKSCPLLVSVNFNYTAVTPASLVPLLTRTKLEVLKIAGIENWVTMFYEVLALIEIPIFICQRDATFSKLMAGLAQAEDFISASSLQTFKLRQTALTTASLNMILPLLPNLKRLDVSFTPIMHLPLLNSPVPPLEKLSLTSTHVTSEDLLSLLSLLPGLKTLVLGAMGGGMRNSSAMTMTDETLTDLSEILERRCLESISLVGNTKLGQRKVNGESSVALFIRRVGRYCKVGDVFQYASYIDCRILLEIELIEPSPYALV
jgi:hypothetical protein